MKHLSTTAISKRLGITSKELFAYLLNHGMVQRENDVWVLTPTGSQEGGKYRESQQHGKYIVWPENLINTSKESIPPRKSEQLLTATAIGKVFDLSANKINFVLSELGWINKGFKGWEITAQGIKNGGIQAEHNRTGIPFVRWPSTITTSKSLRETVDSFTGTTLSAESGDCPKENIQDFRKKFDAGWRCYDGHYVRSKAEVLIDNWLYSNGIVHTYEKQLPIEEKVYSDFFIPLGKKVYIEFWGYENDSKYLARKEKKRELYKKSGFNLIELTDKEVQNIDDLLPKLLLKYEIRTY